MDHVGWEMDNGDWKMDNFNYLNNSMRTYKPSFRVHDFAWMIRHSEDLEGKALKQEDTSKIIYCCLELRNAIEMLEFHLLLGSVPNELHKELTETARPFNGNENVNKKYKSLSHKTQIYYKIVCEISGINGDYFDYKKSQKIRDELSQYVHTYTRFDEEMNFKSSFIKNSFKVIKDARQFLSKSLLFDGKTYTLQNIEYSSLPDEDKILLNEWREDKIKEKVLIERLTEINIRRKNDE